MVRSLSLALFFCSSLTTPSRAQKAEPLTPEQMRALSERILVVELPTVEEWLIEEGPVNDTQKRVIAHRSYLDNIEAVMRTHWTFNKRVEFKTRSECREIFASKSADYLIMMKAQADYYNFTTDRYRRGLDKVVFIGAETTLQFDREGALEIPAPLFHMYLAGDHVDDTPRGMSQRTYSTTYDAASLTFTIVQYDRWLQWSLANGAVRAFAGFVKDEAARNCRLLKGRTLTARQQPAGKGRDSDEDLRKAFGAEVEFVPYEVLMERYMAQAQGTALLMFMPNGKASEGNDVIFGKLVVDPGTNEIIGSAGFAVIGFHHLHHTKAIFKKLAECE